MIPRLSNGAGSGLVAPVLETLLPPNAPFETLWSACRGVIQSAWDPSSRSALEHYYMKEGIIQDSVLQNAPNGSILIFALFHELHHNPLFQKAQDEGIWNPREFHRALGPALTNFHDALFQVTLNNSKKMHNNSQQSSEPEQSVSDPEQLEQIIATDPWELLFGKNTWEDEALENPSSPEAILQNMVTPAFYNQLFYQTQLAQHLTRGMVQTGGEGTPLIMEDAGSHNTETTPLPKDTTQLDWMNLQQQEPSAQDAPRMESIYQPGSAHIGQVAIVRARAREVPENFHYREFHATTNPEGDPVAAEFHILYEVTSRHTETYTPAAEGESKETHEDDTTTTRDPNESNKTNNDIKEKDSSTVDLPHMGDTPWTEEVEYTRLGVAIVEGYLRHSHQALQWRIPLLREPEEFAVEGGSLLSRTVLSSDHGDSEKKRAHSPKD